MSRPMTALTASHSAGTGPVPIALDVDEFASAASWSPSATAAIMVSGLAALAFGAQALSVFLKLKGRRREHREGMSATEISGALSDGE